MHAKSFDRLSQKHEEEDRFFGRVLAKETWMNNSSFRGYYGGSSGAVPFGWESQPGTPKHPCFEASLPPLTLPPSLYLSSSSNFNPNSINKPCSKSNLLKAIFQKLSSKRTENPNSSSSFSFRSSSCSSQASGSPKRRRFSSPNLTYFIDQVEHEPQKVSASRSTTSESCSGVSWKALKGFRGCNGRMGKAKIAFASILGHGSAKTASAF